MNDHLARWRFWHWMAVIAVVLAGAFMRWFYLAETSCYLLYDEAFLGIDSLSLVANPRFVPFFPDNLGAESLWHYLLIPPLIAFGAEPFSLRIAATFTGALSVAVAYVFARTLMGRRGALWAALGFAVLFWHIHMSYYAFRSILIPLVGGLAWTALLNASRSNRRWWLVGILFGLLAYIYFAATVWLVLGILMQGWAFIREREKRRGIALSLLLTGMLIAPIALYVLTSPHYALKRPSMTGIHDLSTIPENIAAWGRAWFVQGGDQPLLNLPGRPILDVPLGILFVAGLIGLERAVKRRWMAGWLLALALVTLIPSLLSLGSPNPARAIGLTLVTAVVFGSGALVVERAFVSLFAIVVRPYNAPRTSPFIRMVGVWIPILLFTWAGLNSLRDYGTYVTVIMPTMLRLEQQIMSAIHNVAVKLPPDAPVYFLSLPYCYPFLGFQAHELGQRQYGAFLPDQRVVIRDAPLVDYVSFERDLDLLLDWIQIQDIAAQPEGYAYVQAIPRPEVVSGWEDAPIAGPVALRLLGVPEIVQAGEPLTLALALRPLQEMATTYSVSLAIPELSLSSDTKTLLGEAETYLCDGAAPPQWLRDEIVVQRFTLPIPQTTSPGSYPVVAHLRFRDSEPTQVVFADEITVTKE